MLLTLRTALLQKILSQFAELIGNFPKNLSKSPETSAALPVRPAGRRTMRV
jgi:hypothetical protein